MTGSQDKKRSYVKLLVVPLVLFILCSTSMVGVGYSSLTSEVVNSDNVITFVRIDNRVTPVGNNSELLTITKETTTIDGVEYPTYDVKFSKTPNLLNRLPITFEVEGNFCIYLKTGFHFAGNDGVCTINNDKECDIKANIDGYFIFEYENSKPKLVKKSISTIIDNKWINSGGTYTFEFPTADTRTGNDFFKFIFKD